jgi:hypothetical protein
VIKVAQAADKGCHTVNSMRKRMPVSGKLILTDQRLTRQCGRSAELKPVLAKLEK